jgi:hypothetical protein
MLEKYINDLDYTSVKTDKIRATKIPFDELNIYIYYDHTKQLHFIIQSDEKASENRKGIKIGNTVLDVLDHGKNTFIDFVCTSVEFKAKFIQIIEEIISLYQENKNLSKSIKITINKWYYFFEKDTNINLSESEIKGVIGELLFIKNFISIFGNKEIINAWKGPESGLRDFNFNLFDVEVKTSSKEVGHIHTINGQLQLKSETIPLFIYSISLKKSESENSINLKKVIDDVCLEIGDDSFLLNEFFEKLEMINVLVSKVDTYNSYSYELKNILTIKITKNNIHDFIIDNHNTRISNLKYDYDFNGLENNEIIV